MLFRSTGAAPTPEQLADYRALTAAWAVTPHLETLLPIAADILAT